MRTAVIGSLVMLLIGTCGCGPPAGPAPVASGTRARSESVPTASTPATHRAKYATVGPLFPEGDLSAAHTCTASVVASPTRDTVITAAHCLGSTGTGMRFVPGYHLGHAPYGIWRVTGACVSTAWEHDQSPAADYAILTIAAQRSAGRAVEIADVTGSERPGHAPVPGMTITAVAYNHGTQDDPVVCDARVFEHDSYPTFDCHGFRAGSSGSPWLTWDAQSSSWILRGVIGGLHQGGCEEYRSHSSAFTSDVDALLRRASSHAPPDSVIASGEDGC